MCLIHVGFIAEIQNGFNIQKSINGCHPIYRLKDSKRTYMNEKTYFHCMQKTSFQHMQRKNLTKFNAYSHKNSW